METGRRVPGGEEDAHAVAHQLVSFDAGGHAARLVLPLVAEDEIDVGESKRGEGLLGLDLDELQTQARRQPTQRLNRRQRQPQQHGLEPGDAGAAGDGARRCGKVGLRDRRALEQRFGVAHQDQGGVGEAHSPTGALEQLHAGLAFQHGELLRYGGRRELKCVRHGRDRASLVQLAQ